MKLNSLSIVLIALMLLTSCATVRKNRQIKRAYKIAAKYDMVTEIAVPIYDTIIVPSVQLDTIVQLSSVFDTLYFDTGRLSVRVVRMPNDTIQVQGECLETVIYRSDTITISVPFISKWDNLAATIENKVIKWYRWGIAIIIFIIIGMLLYKFWDKVYPLIKVGAMFFGIPLP